MRLRQRTTREGSWSRDRDDAMARDIASGLGVRPREWWELESDRPELATATGADVYVHLMGGSALEAARERLRFLDSSGELTPGERSSITRGRGPAYAWRRDVLA